VQTRALAAATKPLVPGPLRCFDESHHAVVVATDAEVIEVTSQAPIERGVLLLNREVPVASAPVVDGLLSPSQARPPCLARHPPVAFAGARPIEREAHKVKGGRTFPTLLRLWRTPKWQQASFVWVQGQSEAPHAFIEYRHHTTRIVLTLKTEDMPVGGGACRRFPASASPSTAGPNPACLFRTTGFSIRLNNSPSRRRAHSSWIFRLYAVSTARLYSFQGAVGLAPFAL